VNGPRKYDPPPGANGWVEHGGDPRNARRDLLEQLQPLAAHRGFQIEETGDVAARPGQARDEAVADRIRNRRHNDGNGVR
jgi:hypothetical protein